MTCPLFCSSEKTQRQGKTRVDNFIQIATFCHLSLKFVPWFTGMGDSLLFFDDKISLFSLVNHECIDHQVSQSGIECTTNVLFLAEHLVQRAGLSLRGGCQGFSPGTMDVGPGYFRGK